MMTYETKKEWVLPEEIGDKGLKRYKGVSETLARLLAHREISSDQSESFLTPQFTDIPSADKLYNTKRAAAEILNAIRAGKKVFIHGDYDCDGVCATAILWQFLHKELSEKLKVTPDVLPYIPDRVAEGYGLSESSIEFMISQGTQLIITVDCGIRDKALIQEFKKKYKVDFIVTDHHQLPEDLLEGLDYTVVHQMFPGKEYPYEKICGSTIVLLLVSAMRKEAGLDYELVLDTPGLDLAGLATVTDLMPLTGANRTLVKFGLEQMQDGRRLGIRELVKNARVHEAALDSYHLGFVIGPRINAAGRIGSAMDALRLMVTETQATASKLASKLAVLNFKRQSLTDEILKHARGIIEKEQSEDKLYFIIGESWSEGIVGLVAGKILEEFGKPVIVATVKDGEVRASARSVKGFNITSAIEKFADQLEKYGGHELAAGFNVKPEKLEVFRSSIIGYANVTITAEMLKQSLKVDLVVDTDDLNIGLINDLDLLKPFGYGNPKPVLMIPQVVVVGKKVMGNGNKHMKLVIKGKGIDLVNALIFDCIEDVEKIQTDNVLDLVGSVSLNEWNGMTEVQFIVKEWRRAKL